MGNEIRTPLECSYAHRSGEFRPASPPELKTRQDVGSCPAAD